MFMTSRAVPVSGPYPEPGEPMRLEIHRRAMTNLPNASAVRLALALSLAGLAVAAPAAAQEGIAIGATPAPVVLETLEGDPVDLSRIIGEKPVLLEFWATWCAVCRALEPKMHAAREAFGERVEFVIIAAAVAQTPEVVRQHLARHPTAARVLWDTQGRFTRAYDAPGTGYIVILDSRGAVAYTGTGAQQDLEGALARVLQPR